MGSNTRAIKESYPNLKNVVYFKFTEYFPENARFAPSLVSRVDSMPVILFFSVIIGKLSPRAPCFENITDCIYAATQWNSFRFPWFWKERLNESKLLIRKHLVYRRKIWINVGALYPYFMLT
jgi:hypothetical protein